ncbi:MAG: agmatinase [Candidatus Bipolaricaulota bacterium]|nr:agmatinase [Candidatus Bipolaricaulota bacterium]MDW8031782.1 agmatinase [Candidatus Bipolaricaulota bacterium]
MQEIPPPRGYWLPQNFGGVPPEFSRFASARVVVLPVPYDLTTSYLAGTRHGPQAIIDASTHLELYDEELQSEPYRIGIYTLPPLEPSAAGPEETLRRVEEIISWLLEHDKFPVMLGGEHSLTLAPVRALRQRFRDFSVLQLDAHADLRESFQGTKFNHACVGRRIHELGLNLVQIGIRAISLEEAEFIRAAKNLHVCFDHELHQDLAPRLPSPRWQGAGGEVLEEALAHLRDPVYVTVDLDVFDPALMPAVGTPEPGGLDWYTVLKILRYVGEKHRVIGCDVVELCPIAGLVGPNFLAAKLVYKMLGYFLKGGQG